MQPRTIGTLSIDQDLYDFAVNEAIPDSGLHSAQFWSALEAIVDEFARSLASELQE